MGIRHIPCFGVIIPEEIALFNDFPWEIVDTRVIGLYYADIHRICIDVLEVLFLRRSAMAIRIVRLGTPRARGEGLRIGTVRRPPRGVSKAHFASRNYYDVWLPEVAPSEQLVKAAQQATDARDWSSFVKRYRGEMKRPEASRLLDLLSALSHNTNLSIGCYCEDENRCHRSVLRMLLTERGAELVRT